MQPRYCITFLLGLACTLMVGCELAGADTDDPLVVLDVPSGFDAVPVPAHNPMTRSKVELGERLFFDPLLSRDRTISCSSCHLPSLAFSDGEPKSIGIEGRIGIRNAQSLVNIAYQSLFFWDGGALTLENQVFAPLQDHNEMDADLKEVLDRLNANASYRQTFEEAFNEDANLRTLTQALAAFQRSIRSGGARYDRYLSGDEGAMTTTEQRGLMLFEGKAGCNTCHSGFLLTDKSFQNNGLAFANADSGRARVTLLSEDFGKFRVPSLRNVADTAPYMHDGRLATLEAVIDHYDQGGTGARGQHEAVVPLGLTDQEKRDLIAFLHSLSDESIRYGVTR